MSTSVVVEILLGLLAAAIASGSWIQARRANREQVRMVTAQAEAASASVDAGAWVRAKDIYEGVVNTLREDLAATRIEIRDLKQSNANLTAELESARRDTAELRISNNQLRREVAELREEITTLRQQQSRG